MNYNDETKLYVIIAVDREFRKTLHDYLDNKRHKISIRIKSIKSDNNALYKFACCYNSYTLLKESNRHTCYSFNGDDFYYDLYCKKCGEYNRYEPTVNHYWPVKYIKRNNAIVIGAYLPNKKSLINNEEFDELLKGVNVYVIDAPPMKYEKFGKTHLIKYIHDKITHLI